jgi:hypothetical protein
MVRGLPLSTSSRPALGPTQLPIHWIQEAVSSRVKLPGREAHQLPPTSIEVKETWIILHSHIRIKGVVFS